MKQDNEFEPDGCEVQSSLDGSQIRLRFYKDDGREAAIVIARSFAPLIAAQLQQQIATGSVHPMNPGGLDLGTGFRLVGRGIQRRTNGGARLTLHVEVTGGGRSIPIDLSSNDVSELIDDLSPCR